MKKTTVGAVAVFVALLGFWYFSRERHINEGVPKLALPTVDQGRVTGFEVSGAQQAILTYKDGKWLVADPKAPEQQFEADEAQVKAALGQMEKLKATDFVTQKAEKQADLEVNDAKGLHLKVHGISPELDVVLGKMATGGGFYVREAAKNAVFVGTGGLAGALRKNVTGWRKKAIPTATAADVVKLSVTPREGEAYVLAKQGDDWKLESPAPKGFRFDPAAATRLVNQVCSLQAQDFQATAPAASEPVTTFVATLKDGKTVTMKLGKKAGAGTAPFNVDGDPQTYLLAGWTTDQLDKTLEGMRDTRLTSVDAAKVKSVTIVTSKGKTVVEKDGTGWKVVEPKAPPAGVEVDVSTIPTLVQRLSMLRGSKVVTGVDDAKAGLRKPLAELEFTVDGGPKQTIRFGGDAESGQAYVKGGVDELLYEIPVFERNNLDQGVALFKKRPPPSFTGSGLEQLPPEVRKQLEAQLRARNN